MNRKYSGLYEYGATANFSKDKSVNRAINEVRYQNLKGFLEDNLDLVKPEKSWYYPDRTCLIFIARPELLDMLSLDGFGEPIVTFAGEMGDPHNVLPQF